MSGIPTATIRRELRRILGLTRPWNVAIVGMRRLGQALADYPRFDSYAFYLKGLFDIDAAKIGTRIAGTKVHHPEDLPVVVREKGINMVFITVPQAGTQEVADALVAVGIKGILNFAPTLIDVPREIHVERVDFMTGLTRSAFYIQNPQLREALV